MKSFKNNGQTTDGGNVTGGLNYIQLEKQLPAYQTWDDYRQNNIWVKFWADTLEKHKIIKGWWNSKLTKDYTSKFDLLYQFECKEPLKFLRHLRTQFAYYVDQYKTFSYEKLPLFYEVKQAINNELPLAFVVDIYGYYIDSEEIKTLKQAVEDFVIEYQNKLECEELTKLYNISILPNNLLHQIKEITKRENINMNDIKLYHARHYVENEQEVTTYTALRVRRGTKIDNENPHALDQIDQLLK